MEDKVSLSKAFTLYLKVENHFRSYKTAKYSLDRILRDEPEHRLVFIDAADMCNLVYPKEMMRDGTPHDVVKKLWLEFFALSKNEEIPFDIQVSITPAAAFEIIELAHTRIMRIGEGVKSKTKTMKLEDWSKNINKNWRQYSEIEYFLDRVKIADSVKKFTNLYDDEKLVGFSNLIKDKPIFSEAKTMDEIKEQVENEIDYEKGSNSFKHRRPKRPLPNKLDMWNFVMCVAYIRSLPVDQKNHVFISSQSGHTLKGWNDSWNLKFSDSPVRASLSENILVTSIVREKGDIEVARDFTVEGQCVCRDIMDGFKTIPEIERYSQESNLKKRKSLRDIFGSKKTEVRIPFRTLSKIEEWYNRFERTKIPLVKSQKNRDPDYKIAERLLKDEKYRQELKEKASYNARKMFSVLEQQGILDINRVFIPEDSKSLEILNWLREI